MNFKHNDGENYMTDVVKIQYTYIIYELQNIE